MSDEKVIRPLVFSQKRNELYKDTKANLNGRLKFLERYDLEFMPPSVHFLHSRCVHQVSLYLRHVISKEQQKEPLTEEFLQRVKSLETVFSRLERIQQGEALGMEEILDDIKPSKENTMVKDAHASDSSEKY